MIRSSCVGGGGGVRGRNDRGVKSSNCRKQTQMNKPVSTIHCPLAVISSITVSLGAPLMNQIDIFHLCLQECNTAQVFTSDMKICKSMCVMV